MEKAIQNKRDQQKLYNAGNVNEAYELYLKDEYGTQASFGSFCVEMKHNKGKHNGK